MKLIITSFLLLGLIASGVAKEDRAAAILMNRVQSLTGKTDAFYCFVPKRSDVPKMVGFVGKAILAASERGVLVIHTEDPVAGTRIVTAAFAFVRPGALRGCTVICAVGKKNDSYIRPVIEATGAKLYVEPLP